MKKKKQASKPYPDDGKGIKTTSKKEVPDKLSDNAGLADKDLKKFLGCGG